MSNGQDLRDDRRRSQRDLRVIGHQRLRVAVVILSLGELGRHHSDAPGMNGILQKILHLIGVGLEIEELRHIHRRTANQLEAIVAQCPLEVEAREEQLNASQLRFPFDDRKKAHAVDAVRCCGDTDEIAERRARLCRKTISRNALVIGFCGKPWASAQRLIVFRQSLSFEARPRKLFDHLSLDDFPRFSKKCVGNQPPLGIYLVNPLHHP